MVRDYFNKVQSMKVSELSNKRKAKVWVDKLLFDEVDFKTFKTGIDVRLPYRRKDMNIGYS